ncbi:MAG: cyanophycin synthetase [Deltaproteobacteria bacterium]|nr:cyanophycin synthetase [Deltaproteobacteria bacterium]
MLEIRKALSLVGPNVWANYPLLEAWVDLGPLDAKPSNSLPGFNGRLMAWLPSLVEHRCSEGVRGGFFSRLREGTWLGHVLEHVTLELQTLAHLPVGYGRTRETSERGVYRVVVECLEHGFGEACLRKGRELLLAAIENMPFDVPGELRRLREVADRRCLGPSTQAIVTAAKARLIPALRVSPGNLVQLGYGKAQRRIWAAETAKTSALAESIAQDKELTRQLVTSVGVPMPAGRKVASRRDAWAAAEDLGLPVVVKPQDANHGRGVSIRLEGRAAVEAAFDIAAREGSGVVVERFVSGTQHRVLVVGREAVAASGGEAEQVVADGASTVEELVARANQDPRRGEESEAPLTPLVLDEISLELLRRQGLEKISVPAAGRTVLIHHNGDFTVDETERLHPEIAASCVMAAQTVGLDVAGIDLIAEDIGRPLEAQNGAIIEVNASPGLVMHLKPLVGKPRPVGEAIVNHLFPAGESGRVPLVAVSGTNGKSTVASLVGAMLSAASRQVGLATSDGLRVGQRRLASGDRTDAASARRLLVNPFVDDIVVETSEIGVLREGLAFDRCQVSVITNLGWGDHMGELFVDSREMVAKAIRAPLDVVLPDGHAVLNAAEPDVAAMAGKCKGGIVYFAPDPRAGPLGEHLAAGGRAVFVANETIVVGHGTQVQRLFELANLRSPLPGLPQLVVENLLAAAGAGLALGLPPGAIRQGLLEAQALGGDRLYAAGDRNVLVTQARNPSALAAWLSVIVSAFPGRRLRAAVEVPSDWRPDDASEMGRLLADGFETAILVAAPGDPTIENLFRIVRHPALAREAAWACAIDRIMGEAGSSDLIFVGPSTRAGSAQANEHCKKRNMVRLS